MARINNSGSIGSGGDSDSGGSGSDSGETDSNQLYRNFYDDTEESSTDSGNSGGSSGGSSGGGGTSDLGGGSGPSSETYANQFTETDTTEDTNTGLGTPSINNQPDPTPNGGSSAGGGGSSAQGGSGDATGRGSTSGSGTNGTQSNGGSGSGGGNGGGGSGSGDNTNPMMGIAAGLNSDEGVQQTQENIQEATQGAREFRRNDPFEKATRPGGESDIRLDRGITNDLTRSGGFFSEQQEGDIKGLAREIGSTKQTVERTVGGRQDNAVENAFEGVANFGISVANVPRIVQTGETAVEVAQNAPGEIQEEGAKPVATQAGKTAVLAGQEAVRSFRANPVEEGASTVAGFVTGTAFGKVAQRVPGKAREAKIKAKGGDVVDVGDVSDPPTTTEGMGLPGFTDEAQADPQKAATEFTEQAEANAIGGDEPVAFHGRSPEAVSEYGGFGSSFEAPEGGSELPGLFQSADLSPLRLPESEEGSGGMTFGLPKPNVRSSRVLAEKGVDVGVTEGSSRQEVSSFLSESASRDQSFVRTDSGGGPTPEQEVIAPPGSQFQEVDSGGLFGVRVGNDVIPGRLTERTDAGDTDGSSGDGTDTLSRSDLADETTQAIRESRRTQAQQPDVPYTPTNLFGEMESRSASGTDDSRGPTDSPGGSPLGELPGTRETPTGPPSDEPTGSPPGLFGGPTSPPGSSPPERSTPSTSPSDPFGGGSSLFGFGPTPDTTGGNRNRRGDEDDGKEPDTNQIGGLSPTGSRYTNPIMSAETALVSAAENFGGLGGGQSQESSDSQQNDSGGSMGGGLFGEGSL